MESLIVTSKSKARVFKLWRDCGTPNFTQTDAPHKLTIRQLFHNKKFAKLRDAHSIIKTEYGLQSIKNLKTLGFCTGCK